MYVDASLQCQHLKLVAFPDFFKHPNIHYDGEYLPKQIPSGIPELRGPLTMHATEGFYDVDGIFECKHAHQVPVQVNEGEKQLYRCIDCGLVSGGPDFSGCNLLDPRYLAPKDIDKELDDLESMELE
jgi:hypothetical protein